MIVYRKIFTLIFFVILYSQSIKINDCSIEDLKVLPLSKEKIESIHEYVSKSESIEEIFDLLNIDNITVEDIHKIKAFIVVDKQEDSQYIKNKKKSSYKLERWLGAEGNSEGLSEIWLDYFFEPQNINTMTRDQLFNLPNLSPIDVVAILKQKERGVIKGTFQLKNSPNLSYWGYKNLVDFINYKDTEKKGWHMHFSSMIRTTPVSTSSEDEAPEFVYQSKFYPEQFYKLRVNFSNYWQVGYAYHRNMGESHSVINPKAHLMYEKNSNTSYYKIIVGAFTAAFGQGVVLENSDYFSPRRTGHGFSKRALGLNPDLTRSDQYQFNGLALHVSNRLINASWFTSFHSRDAIINQDGSFTTLINMEPRLPYGYTNNKDKIFGSMINSVNEMTFGGNLRFNPTLESMIGFTFYESQYDRVLDPQVILSITGGEDDFEPELDETNDYDDYSGDAFFNNKITNSADAEINNLYSSESESSVWKDAMSTRRVVGAEFSIVKKNISIQGEYGEIRTELLDKDRPSAWVVNLFGQFNDLSYLILFRDYDLDFDNPYQRSFSNYQRYKTTIFEDSYWLEDPIFYNLYSNCPQPQSEKGVYLNSRYKFSRTFVSYINWDSWIRKADNEKYSRIVATVEWQPLFNYRLNVRQKWQSRGDFNIFHASPYSSRETRVRLKFRMSNYNNLELLYSNGYTSFSPRPRLTDSAVGGEMVVGDIGSPDESIGLTLSFNFDSHLKMKLGTVMIDGFLWYFEGNDFRVFNSNSMAVHNWILFTIKPTSNFTASMKVTHFQELPSTSIKETQTTYGQWINNPLVNNQTTDFKVQVNYAL